MYKIASVDSDISDLKGKSKDLFRDIKDTQKDLKDLKNDFKKLEEKIEKLNIGSRQFWQQTSIFTSLQRKIEKFEVVQQEWKKYKEDMDDQIRNTIEKKFKAQVKV